MSASISASRAMPASPRPVSAGAARYRVFLSYSHADTKWARWLMRRLELYTVPKRFHGRSAPIGEVGRRIAPVFRDRDELPSTNSLGETIRAALHESATLVVICSPSASRSRWVQEEILAFKRLHGEKRIFAFIVAGEPKEAGAADDCFPPALRAELGGDGELSEVPAEVVAADARPEGDGPKLAFVRLVAGLLGVGFDELRQRELQRRYRRMTLVAASLVVGMVITLGLAATAWQARNDARRRQGQAEDLVSFMLGDLWTQLERVGRLDVLDTTGDKSMAYFAGLDLRDLTDVTLLQQVKALTQIGKTRLAQVRYAEAARAFATAYARAAVLAARHPRDGAMLFERGQAEYYIGFVHWRWRQLAVARQWFTRYRATGAALVELDPARPEWQGELAYGHHNLAVLELDDAKLPAAREGLRAELVILEKILAGQPGDLALQFRLADAHSWLGTIAEREGNFPEALLRFAEQVERIGAIARADPGTARWRARLADALGIHASLLAITGHRTESSRQRMEARKIFDALVASDPKNNAWLRAALSLRLKEAELVRAEGDNAAAAQLVDATRNRLEGLVGPDPREPEVAARLATALRLQAELRLETGAAGARELAARAVEIGERLVSDVQPNDAYVGELAQARVTAGRIATQAGEPAVALRHWQRALAVIEPRVADSNHWRILVPAVHVYWALDRRDESRAVLARVQQLGYRPLQPWPDGAAP